MLLLIMSYSCSKNELTEVRKDIPEFETSETVVEFNDLRLSEATMIYGEASLVASYDEEGNVNTYNLILSSLDSTETIFQLAFMPSNLQPSIQEGFYPGFFAITIDQIAIDLLEEWDENDGTIEEFQEIMLSNAVSYQAENISIVASDITDSSVQIELSGYMESSEGDTVEVEGNVEAAIQ